MEHRATQLVVWKFWQHPHTVRCGAAAAARREGEREFFFFFNTVLLMH